MNLFEKIKNPIDTALEKANMDLDEVNSVVMVGGVTRTPWVKEWIRNYFRQQEIFQFSNVDEGVAMGAAYMAGLVTGKIRDQDDE